MGFQLQPADIVDAFTAEQIDAKITSLLTAIENAEASAMDKFDDMQASQQVRRQKLEDLYSTLAVWVKAKNLLAGADSSTASLTAADYNPVLPRI